MIAEHSIKVDAVFEDGVFRPTHPLPIAAHQRVTLIVQFPAVSTGELNENEPAEDMSLCQPGDYLAQLADYEERLARGEIRWQ